MTPAEATERQLAYIANERKRMETLQAAFRAYKDAANSLGLHPLTQTEIDQRLAELNGMEREANTPEYGQRQVQIAAWMNETVE